MPITTSLELYLCTNVWHQLALGVTLASQYPIQVDASHTLGGTTTTDWRSAFLHFYLTTLQFKNFNIPCMRKSMHQGANSLEYIQGPTSKGGAN